MTPILTLFAIILLIWLLVMTLRQRDEIAALKQQLQFLTAKVFAESSTEEPAEKSQPDTVAQSVFPQATQPVYYTPPQNYERQYYAPYQQSTEKKEAKGDMESWLGRNVIGILASILVFMGLVFLGVLAYDYITETGKIIAMYLISTIILGLGIVLSVKKRNNFSMILAGCGCGSFFISILLTHIYFNKINDITAFSLLLVWMAATLLLSKKVVSTHLSIVAHIGMIISICFAYAQGLSDEKLAILMIYQGASIAIILLGNVFCCKKTFHFGVFVSLAITVIASGFMWGRFQPENIFNSHANPFATSLPTAFVATAFIAQFLCGCFLSYLLSVSTSRLKMNDGKIAIHLVNKALWVILLMMNVSYVVYRMTYSTTSDILQRSSQHNYYAVLIAVLITLAVILIHAAITLILSLKLNFEGKLETISILFLSIVASLLLFVLWCSGLPSSVQLSSPHIIWLFVVSLLLILARYIAKNKTYSLAANLFLALDAIFMLAYGYQELNNFGTILLSLGYLVLYLGIIMLQWFLFDAEEKAKHSKTARLLSFFLTELSLIVIISTSAIRYHTEILLIVLTALNTILYIVRYDKDNQRPSVIRWVFTTNEFLLLSGVSAFIAFAHKDPTSSALSLLLAALAFGLAFIRIRRVLDGSSGDLEGIWTGLKLTVLVLAVIQGNTDWFEQTYIFSIVCMLTALLCIILGFLGRAKTLRFYGLALTLLCILKFVTLDVTNLNTILRVVAFIGGGIICFIISAIYNYTAKMLAENQKNDNKI